MNDVNTAIPCVRAIIQRVNNGNKQILIQTRHKPGTHPTKSDPIYSGTLEIPGGKLDNPYANIFDELAREIKEETNLILKSVINNDLTQYISNKNDLVIGFQPFYCSQQLLNGLPWISYVFVCETENGELISQKGETKNPKWISLYELSDAIKNRPNEIFTFDLPPLVKYLQLNNVL